MSQIFVIAAVALLLLVAAVVFNTAVDNSGSEAESLDAIVDILGTGIEVGALVPIIILIALFVAVLGVWARL